MDPLLLAQLERQRPRSVLLLGACDTGKTALLEELLKTGDSGVPIAVVDCDVGQSRLGPPTTVGWSLVTPPFPGWPRTAVRGIVFTGAVSPEGNLETFLDAVSRMVHAARQAAPRLIVDTTGLVGGELGQAVKTRKIALIEPDLILALEQDRELELILAACPSIPMMRLRPSPQVIRRSLPERDAYRDRQFARYFANAMTHAAPLTQFRLIGLGPDWPTGAVECSPAALVDRVVGLRNAAGEDLAVGLVRELDPAAQRVRVMTPLKDVSAITTLAVGSIRWPTEPGF